MLVFLLFAWPFLFYLILADAVERELIYVGAVRDKWIRPWIHSAVNATGLLANALWQAERFARWPNILWLNWFALGILLLSWICFWYAHQFGPAAGISVVGLLAAAIQMVINTEALSGVWLVYHGYNALSLTGFAHLFRRLDFETRAQGRL